MAKPKQWKAILVVAMIVAAAMTVYLVRRGPNGADAADAGPASWDTETRAWVQARRDRATEYLSRGSFNEAHAVLAELLRERDDDPVAHALMFRVYLSHGQPDKAYQSAKRSLELDPDQHDLQLDAGQVAERLGSLMLAEAHYAKAVELRPDDARYVMHLANVRLKQDKLDAAQVDALRAIALDPATHQAYRLLAEIAAKKGQTQRAVEQIDKALALVEPMTLDTLQYTLRKAVFLRRLGPAGREEALNVLMALPKNMHGTRVEIAQEMAITYLSLNRPADAAGVWEFWFTAHPYDAKAAAEAGLAHVRAGNKELAARWYDKARSLKPHLTEVQALGLALDENP